MKEFLALYRFNFKRIFNTWMIRVLAIVILGCMLGGIIYVHGMNKTIQIGVRVDSENISGDFFVGLLNASAVGYEYSLENDKTEYDGYVQIEIEAVNEKNNIQINIISDEEDYISVAQTEIIKSGVEQYIYTISGYNYPFVTVQEMTRENISVAEEIAFYIIAFILYLFILLCGSIITSSVALEKTSRVSELITYRVSVLKLIYSKVLALYSIIAMLLMGMALEFFIAIKTGWIELSDVIELLDMAGFGAKEIGIVSVIIISGILVYTVLYVFVGAMIKSADQIQFSQLPVAVIVLAGYMITVLCRQNTDSLINKICTYIPTFSPFLAVTKLFQPGSHGAEFAFMGLCTIIFLVAGNWAIVVFYKKENQ